MMVTFLLRQTFKGQRKLVLLQDNGPNVKETYNWDFFLKLSSDWDWDWEWDWESRIETVPVLTVKSHRPPPPPHNF